MVCSIRGVTNSFYTLGDTPPHQGWGSAKCWSVGGGKEGDQSCLSRNPKAQGAIAFIPVSPLLTAAVVSVHLAIIS